MSQRALVAHYQAVAEDSPIPIMLYSVPKFTHLDLEIGTVVEAASHPNIVGIKDSGGSVAKVGDLVRQAPEGFQVLAGSASFFFAALALGAVGGVLALANVAPQQALEIHALYRAGRWEEAAELQRRMLPVNRAVTGGFGIAGLKAALDMLGYRGGCVRSPLQSLTEDERRSLRAILHAGGLAVDAPEATRI
jgi:4-hydroxy-2-oxoglutarate aldolase